MIDTSRLRESIAVLKANIDLATGMVWGEIPDPNGTGHHQALHKARLQIPAVLVALDIVELEVRFAEVQAQAKREEVTC